MPETTTPLAEAITRSGLQKVAIAEWIGVRPETLSRWLNGNRSPDAEHKRRLAAVLRVRVEDLFPGIEG